MLSLFTGTIALTSLLMPHYPHIWMAFIGMTLNGAGGGAWDASSWLVELWPTGNAPLLQANQFLYGVGTTVSPLVASKFIFGEANFTGSEDGKMLLTQDLRRRYLAIPYAINGVAQFIGEYSFERCE